jgi:oxygen-dependent protoporphyrinogen oxidase
MPQALVIGGGISGLAAALTLHEAGQDVLVLEAEARIGGVIQTHLEWAFRFDLGPSSWVGTSPQVDALLERIGASDHAIQATEEAKRRFLLHEGELVAVEPHPMKLLRSPLLSLRGRLRLLLEPFISRGDLSDNMTFAEFMDRRIGAEARAVFVDAFVGGIHAAQSEDLGAVDAFPRLVQMVRDHGSLTGGLRHNATDVTRATTSSFHDGMEVLPQLVAAHLGKERIRLASPVSAITLGDEGDWEVTVGGANPTRLQADKIIVAIPAPASAELLAPLAPETWRFLSNVRFAPMVVVGVGARKEAFSGGVPEGFGFLVPPGQSEALLGCIHSSNLFPGRAPEGAVALNCFAGGIRHPEVIEWEDAKLRQSILGALATSLGLRSEPNVVHIRRIPHAIPQYTPGHRRRIAAVQAELNACRGIALAGNHIGGVSLHDSIASGEEAAHSVLDSA